MKKLFIIILINIIPLLVLLISSLSVNCNSSLSHNSNNQERWEDQANFSVKCNFTESSPTAK